MNDYGAHCNQNWGQRTGTVSVGKASIDRKAGAALCGSRLAGDGGRKIDTRPEGLIAGKPAPTRYFGVVETASGQTLRASIISARQTMS
ncbi:hypothetical protein UCMB321_5002 [Pseudomonas batumici]|uniref:Uncharacterized protein n=1 Tax=Pseudomonas batumici TaxID=226910 RepID=A0A0C2HVM3_9PSED|nr:hypothetical protein UCMB321_5002 [Pseudomonas batumici]